MIVFNVPCMCNIAVLFLEILWDDGLMVMVWDEKICHPLHLIISQMATSSTTCCCIVAGSQVCRLFAIRLTKISSMALWADLVKPGTMIGCKEVSQILMAHPIFKAWATLWIDSILWCQCQGAKRQIEHHPYTQQAQHIYLNEWHTLWTDGRQWPHINSSKARNRTQHEVNSLWMYSLKKCVRVSDDHLLLVSGCSYRPWRLLKKSMPLWLPSLGIEINECIFLLNRPFEDFLNI